MIDQKIIINKDEKNRKTGEICNLFIGMALPMYNILSQANQSNQGVLSLLQ